MTAAAWASVAAILVVAVFGGVAALMREGVRAGRREGKLDAILELLTDGHIDHEQRLRELEKKPRRG